MFEGFDYGRVVAMTDQERRWHDNIKKAVYESDISYRDGHPEDRGFEELCKAVDTCKTLRRSLRGEPYTTLHNKKYFTEFLDLELPTPEHGGVNLTLFDDRRQESVQYSFSLLIYAIRCMVHENENLNADESPDFHVLLDWKMHTNDRCGGVLTDKGIVLNARATWKRLREVVTKFALGLDMMIAIELGNSCSMEAPLCGVRPSSHMAD